MTDAEPTALNHLPREGERIRYISEDGTWIQGFRYLDVDDRPDVEVPA